MMKEHIIPEDRTLTGHLTPELLKRLKSSISNYIAKNEWFYLGITNRPYQRSIEHEWRNHDRMVLLYRTSSQRYVRILEAELVDKYRQDSKYQEKMTNATGGGGGCIGEGTQYLYILLKKPPV